MVVALAESEGAERAFGELEKLDAAGYYLYHAVRGDLLARLGRPDEAIQAIRSAIDMTDNKAEQRLLEDRIASLVKNRSDGRSALP